MSETDRWVVPGLPRPALAPEPAPDVAPLLAAVDKVLAVVPQRLDGGVALDRVAVLLRVQQRLQAAVLSGVADVDARDLAAQSGAGGTRTWLRTVPGGDPGQLADARLLADRPLVLAALAEGSISSRTALTVARALGRVPSQADDAELRAVLVDGVGDLLSTWAGSACLDPTPQQEQVFEERRQQLVDTVRQGLADSWSDPAGRLEPAFVLAAQVLAPAEVTAGLAVLVDALQPEAVEDRAEQQHRARDLVLRRLSDGGWSLRGHLTPEVGQLMADALEARSRVADPSVHASTARDADDTDDSASAAAAADDTDDSASAAAAADSTDDGASAGPAAHGEDVGAGTAGAGVPLDLSAGAEEGAVRATPGQRAHDALASLLADAVDVAPGAGRPAPVALVVTASVDAVEGRPGAVPARLQGRSGSSPLSLAALRRLGCGSTLTAVLLDARQRPVGVSGTHRSATARERHAMQTMWGRLCAVNGCGRAGPVPHHVEPWWKTHRTRLADLVPLCEHHHHDLHDGHRLLRLRDGRTCDEWGWRADAIA